MSRVELDIMAPFLRHLPLFEDRVNGAFILTSSARGAFIGVDEHLTVLFTAVDAIHGANLHASLVFHTDAGFDNYISHNSLLNPDVK
jgi:hypothetical protein